MLQHKQEEVADDHSDYDSVTIYLELIFRHFGKFHLFIYFFVLIGVFLLSGSRFILVISFGTLRFRDVIEQIIAFFKDLGLKAMLLEELSVC